MSAIPSPRPPAVSGSSEVAAVEKLKAAREAILGEIHKVIVGQTEVMDYLLIAMFSRGHCLLVGVPGLAKTLMISTLAKVLSLRFNRIQFTPDLMPSDITGTEIIQEDVQTGQPRVQLRQGPGLCQHAPGRRNQPHAAQDPGGAAAGHAGIAGHRQRPDLSAGPAVLRAGDAEPGGAGRHLSPARGAARPLHVHGESGLPVA